MKEQKVYQDKLDEKINKINEYIDNTLNKN